MPESIAEFKHESIQDRQSIVKYLKTLWEGIENGRIVFDSEEEEIELVPSDLITLKLRVVRAEDRSRINLQFSWKAKSGSTKSGNLIVRT